MDNKIGKRSDGVTIWPAVTLGGAPYTRPVTTVNVGEGAFVVLDPFPAYDVQQALDAIRNQLAPKTKRAREARNHEPESATTETPDEAGNV